MPFQRDFLIALTPFFAGCWKSVELSTAAVAYDEPSYAVGKLPAQFGHFLVLTQGCQCNTRLEGRVVGTACGPR